jgi:hypothetical protein
MRPPVFFRALCAASLKAVAVALGNRGPNGFIWIRAK